MPNKNVMKVMARIEKNGIFFKKNSKNKEIRGKIKCRIQQRILGKKKMMYVNSNSNHNLEN